MNQGIDYIGITTVFYCHDGKGNLLLHKRTGRCRDEQGRWDAGGGSLRFHETFIHGVKREIEEEYCCKPKKLQFVGVNNVLRKHNGIQTHWVAVIFAAKVNPEEVKIGVPTKMEQIGWFKPNNLPKPLHSMYLTHLEFLKRKRIHGI